MLPGDDHDLGRGGDDGEAPIRLAFDNKTRATRTRPRSPAWRQCRTNRDQPFLRRRSWVQSNTTCISGTAAMPEELRAAWMRRLDSPRSPGNDP
jgi:hypothetical protein